MAQFLRILQLTATAITPAIAALLLHLLLKKIKKFNSLNYWIQQTIIGVIFSIFAVCSFLFGVKYTGAPFGDLTRTYDQLNLAYGTANASPIIAGLAFGWPAGLISGFLGGIFRTFCHPFGVDDVLRSPDAVGVFLAGVAGALLRRFLFNNKKPKWGYAFLAGLMVEVFHCNLILVIVGFIRDDVNYSYGLVAQCDIAIILCVAIASALALFLIAVSEREPIKINVRDKKLSSKIQRWMILGLGATFLVVGTMTYLATYNKSSRDLTNDLYNNAYDCNTILQVEWENLSAKDKAEAEKKWGEKDGIVYNVAKGSRVKSQGFNIVVDEESNIKSICYELIDLYNHPFYINNDPNQTILNIPKDTVKICTFSDSVRYYYYVDKIDLSAEKNPFKMDARTYYSISIVPTEEVKIINGLQLRVSIYLEILAFFAIYTIIYSFIRAFVIRNIEKINNSLAQITEGNLNLKVNVRDNEEFSSLSDDINKTVDTLKGYIDEANKRFDKDLATAKEIQHSSLPYIFPTSPEYDLYAFMKTAKQVGGDFYDFFPIDNHHIFFSIADVSGKGIPAAMFMMKSKTLIKSLLQTNELTLDQIITTVNEELNDHNDAMMFVTGWFGILDLKEGKLDYVNCGHNPPLIKSNGKPFEYLQMEKNFVLGAMDNLEYKRSVISFNPGDIIILYTDGVTEATSTKLELYGEQRLLDLINNLKFNTSSEAVDSIIKSVDEFQSGAEQADDITTLVVKYNKKSD